MVHKAMKLWASVMQPLPILTQLGVPLNCAPYGWDHLVLVLVLDLSLCSGEQTPHTASDSHKAESTQASSPSVLACPPPDPSGADVPAPRPCNRTPWPIEAGLGPLLTNTVQKEGHSPFLRSGSQPFSRLGSPGCWGATQTGHKDGETLGLGADGTSSAPPLPPVP